MARKKPRGDGQSIARSGGFGAFVRARRQALGFSLTEFCRQNGLDKGNFSRLERGILPPPRDRATLRSYAKALGLIEETPGWNELFRLAREPVDEKRARRSTAWTRERHLERWAEQNDAMGRLPQLVRLLVRATLDHPSLVRFPAGEGIQRHGWDGMVETEQSTDFVPEGVSGWELSTRKDVRRKANEDFEDRTEAASGSNVSQVSFVFVTPRKWDNKDKTAWCQEKNSLGTWKSVQALDSSDLEQWLETAPAVDAWIARCIGIRPRDGVTDLEEHWSNLRETTDPPLAPHVFVASRDCAVKEVRTFLGLPRERLADSGMPPISRPSVLAIEAASPTDVLDFLAAVTSQFDENERDQIESRLVIVETEEACRDLREAQHRLVLVAHPRLSIGPEAIASAVRQGHQVLLCSKRFLGEPSQILELPPPRCGDLQRALLESGVTEELASRIVEDSGRSLAVVKRRLTRYPHSQMPAWADPSSACDLLPMLLAGAWNDANTADQAVMAQLADRPYHEVLAAANQWLQQSDSPVMRIQSTWSLVSREDSWRLLAPLLTRCVMERFTEVALQVLGSDDPSLGLPPEERWCAALHGKEAKYSKDLRRGVAESLVLFAVKPPGRDVSNSSSISVDAIVRTLLCKNAPWTRWASLADQLALLAEAAPDVLLSAIERDLDTSEPATLRLFEESCRGSDGLGRCYHAGLLWALETLTWSPDDFPRAAKVLARLADQEPATGAWGNSPMKSLVNVFLPWYPQTTVEVRRRTSILERLLKQTPRAGWQVLINLLPGKQPTSDPIQRPRWRDWADAYTAGVTGTEIRELSAQIAALLLEGVDTDAARIEDVIREIHRFPNDQRDQLIARLETIPVDRFDEASRDKIVIELRRTATCHRRFADASWVLPDEVIGRLEKLRERFEPDSPMKRHAWLFGEGTIDFEGSSFEEREHRLRAMQRNAIREVLDVNGLESVLELVKHAGQPRLVGFVLGRESLIEDDAAVLPRYLSSENAKLAEFGKGYFHGRVDAAAWSWVEQLRFDDWTVQQAGSVLAELAFQRRTWDLVARRSSELQAYYWEHATGFFCEPILADVTFAVENFLRHRRPIRAIGVLDTAARRHCDIDPDLVLWALEAAREEGTLDTAEKKPSDFGWSIGKLIAHLQTQNLSATRRLAHLEWFFLPLLVGRIAQPKTLISVLRDEPSFFVEMIRFIFPSAHSHPDESAIRTEEQQCRARSMYKLLMAWRDSYPPQLPGSQSDGTLDAERLLEWVRMARRLCDESGHLDVCDLQLGEILASAPESKDVAEARWPSESVCDLLEEINSESLIRGFQIGILNKCRANYRAPAEGGGPERTLRDKYQAYATACRDEWPRVAGLLRRVVEHYDRQAAGEDQEAKRWM